MKPIVCPHCRADLSLWGHEHQGKLICTKCTKVASTQPTCTRCGRALLGAEAAKESRCISCLRKPGGKGPDPTCNKARSTTQAPTASAHELARVERPAPIVPRKARDIPPPATKVTSGSGCIFRILCGLIVLGSVIHHGYLRRGTIHPGTEDRLPRSAPQFRLGSEPRVGYRGSHRTAYPADLHSARGSASVMRGENTLSPDVLMSGPS